MGAFLFAASGVGARGRGLIYFHVKLINTNSNDHEKLNKYILFEPIWSCHDIE